MFQRLNILVFFSCILFSNQVLAMGWNGALAPKLGISNESGKTINVEDLKGKFTVLYFYPKDETPGCTLEANNFRKDYQKYTALETRIIGVSLDDVESHTDFIKAHGLPFSLLADIDGEVSKRYRVLSNFGLMKFAKRQTFIIDPDGVIVKHYKSVVPADHSQQILNDLPTLIDTWKSAQILVKN